ncbi:glutaredoxin domain-containing protein [Rhodococcoides fascians]|uniref:glutaredoxin domain-containing protein n=1 Tax=Rhodococcoides fascians TaxID=1828 RepID=UPI0018AFB23E
MHFEVFSSPGCQRCKLTAKRLSAAGHDVDLIDVTVTDGAYDRALEISGGAKTLPIVRAENGDSWVDFRIDRLKHYGA